MSIHDPDLEDGARAVARLADMPPREARFVADMRLWLSAPEGQADVWNRAATLLGPERGGDFMRRFEAFLAAVAKGAARPLRRRLPGCACLGADEAAMAAVLRCADAGDLPTATAMARLLVAPAACRAVVVAAGALTPALAEIEEATARRHAPFPAGRPSATALPARRPGGATLH